MSAKRLRDQRREAAKRNEVHVMPQFGRVHDCAESCWCKPMALPETLNRDEYNATVWVHEVPN